MDDVVARAVLASGVRRALWWRPRAIAARAGGLVLERRGGDQRFAWDEVDAVIDLDPVLIESRGRVIARLDPDHDDAAAVIAAIVERAGLMWVERVGRRRVPRMAVRPAVAARLSNASKNGNGEHVQ
jgi:hypothetical protein